MTLTVGSLFAGIGGIELGLKRAGGFETVWQVEKDDYCRQVLAKHWPDVTRYEDVTDVGADELEPVDLICGGFPCQDISVAGKGEGIEGERSGLWSEMWRIIRELRPRYALVENVPALRSRGLGRVLGDLAEIGYDAEWESLSASDLGAPHRRERIFIVAYADGDGRKPSDGRRPVRDGDGDRASSVRRPQQQPGPYGDGEVPSDTHRERRRHAPERHTAVPVFGGRPAPKVRQWSSEPGMDRLGDGFSGGVDRRKALGNAVVPQVAEWIGRRIVEHAEVSR